MPKAMLVFAHPDDETVALGARLGRFVAAHLVHVTDGAPRNEEDSGRYGFGSWREYRDARASELRQVLDVAGLQTVSHECLGIPDQEASQHLVSLTQRIAEIAEQHQPEVIFTHPFEGGHPDHDACAFAVHHAVGRLKMRGNKAPMIIEGAFYHAAAQGAEAGTFVPSTESTPNAEYRLTATEQARKQSLIDCFTTQKETLRYFPLECERFRIAPRYEFCESPYKTAVLYDRFPWGMTSQRFTELARVADATLREEMHA